MLSSLTLNPKSHHGGQELLAARSMSCSRKAVEPVGTTPACPSAEDSKRRAPRSWRPYAEAALLGHTSPCPASMLLVLCPGWGMVVLPSGESLNTG